MRACHTNNCPVGIATQKEHLRRRLPVELAAKRLERFFESSVELMKVLATTWKRNVAYLTGVQYGGVAPL